MTIKAAFLIVLTLIGAALPQNGYELFQKALVKERAEGRLEEALAMYERVLFEFSSDRALAARTLVRIGECREKLQRADARTAYERVLRDYADQKEAVAEARARLGRRGPADRANGMSSRQVWAGGVVYGNVSHDGRYFPYTDFGKGGDLFLHEIASGANRQITFSDGLARLEFAESGGAFSPDDTQLAYGWFNKDRFELRVIGLETPGSSRPRVLFSNPEMPRISPEDWSADGKWIAVQLQRKDKTAQVGLVEVQDGALRILKSVDWLGSSKLFFSPDSKYLAYDVPAADTSDRRDVFVLAVDGSREIPAVVHPSNDVLMGWSPDGRHLLFTSDRTGSNGLWSLVFMDGKPQGTPEQIKAGVTGSSMGMTSKGTLYSLVHHSNFTGVIRSNIQVAAFDFAKGQFLSTPTLAVQTFVGANNFPAWSPDGKYLAFLSRRGEMAVGQISTVFGILSYDTGQLRELRPGLNIYVGGTSPRWSLDGGSLAINATDSKGRQGIFRIDAVTGEATPLALSSRGPVGGESFINPIWAPDGKRIYYSRVNRPDTVLVERDLGSGNEKEIMRMSGRMPLMVDLSPDGKYFAVPDGDWFAGPPATLGRTGKWNILLFPASGGEPKELMRGESHGAGVLMWAPDSRSIFVYSMKDKSTGDREVWRVAIMGQNLKNWI
ncbi:MAG: PD40 domain-containing protein [Acidobacteria bacterium]|nr:PD40 domain-containing protein [Acidobacteriota bacterium]